MCECAYVLVKMITVISWHECTESKCVDCSPDN